jgi:hypothetical protein
MKIVTKNCVFCNATQPLTNFIKNKYCSLGYNNKCKSCQKEYRANYNKNNKIKILDYNIKYNKTYNPKWALNNPHIVFWRSLVNRFVQSNNYIKKDKTESVLGYSNFTFKSHIENQFTEDMNWGNVHIDHKIPLSWFKNNTPINIVNNLSNLHPLSAFDNISKLNRFNHKVNKEYWELCKEFIKEEYLNKIN